MATASGGRWLRVAAAGARKAGGRRRRGPASGSGREGGLVAAGLWERMEAGMARGDVRDGAGSRPGVRARERGGATRGVGIGVRLSTQGEVGPARLVETTRRVGVSLSGWGPLRGGWLRARVCVVCCGWCQSTMRGGELAGSR